jgi:predicted DNA-binding protein (UPF0251 family)
VANKVSVLIDIVTDGAQDSVKKLTKSMREADTLSGKFKVGWEGALGAVKKNAAEFAVVAGAALVAFGVKAVNAFTETALAAGKFSDATGIAVDDASRWMEVGGDVGIGADAIQGAIQKMNKALADGKPAFKEYGVEVVRTSDGLVDANATFRNALTTIGAIPDPTKRAQAAQQLFGKSYGEVSRLMEMSATDLKAALDGVGDAQVIDESELRKAREFEAAMDALRDVVGSVTNEVGEALTPAITDLAEALADVNGAFDELGGAGNVFSALYEGSGLNDLLEGVGTLGDLLDQSGDITVEYEGDLKAAQAAQKGLATTIDGVTIPAVDSLTDSTELARKAAEKLDRQWDELKGEIDDERAFLDMEQTFIDLRTAAEEAYIAAASGADDAAEKQRTFRNAVLDAREQVIEFGANVLNLPTSHVTALQLLADQNQFDELERRLAILTRNRTMNLDIIARGGAGYGSLTPTPRAMGGPISAGQPYLVGERGPELVVPSGSGNVIPAGKTASMMGGTTVINITTGADPQAVIAAIKKYEKSNGAAWRS